MRAAPALILLFSDKNAYLDRYAEPDKGWTDRDEARWPVPYWDIDTGMAAMIALLAIVDQGLAALLLRRSRRTDGRASAAAFDVPAHLTAGRRDQRRIPGAGPALALAAARTPSARRRGQPTARSNTFDSACSSPAGRVAQLGRHDATIRSRSSTEANSTVILPLRRPSRPRPGCRSGPRAGRPAPAIAGRVTSAGAGTRALRSVAPCPLRSSDTSSSVARTDSPSATIRAARSSWPSASSRPSSARACPADSTPGGDPALHRYRQVQQPDRVADLRAAAPDPGGQLVVGDAELLQQLLVGRGLLQRVELGAVDVLQQGVAQHGVVGGVADDGRDAVEPGRRGRPQPALAHDQLVAAVAGSRGRRPAAARRTRGPSGSAPPARPRRRPGGAAWGWAGSRRPAARRSCAPGTGSGPSSGCRAPSPARPATRTASSAGRSSSLGAGSAAEVRRRSASDAAGRRSGSARRARGRVRRAGSSLPSLRCLPDPHVVGRGAGAAPRSAISRAACR